MSRRTAQRNAREDRREERKEGGHEEEEEEETTYPRRSTSDRWPRPRPTRKHRLKESGLLLGGVWVRRRNPLPLPPPAGPTNRWRSKQTTCENNRWTRDPVTSGRAPALFRREPRGTGHCRRVLDRNMPLVPRSNPPSQVPHPGQ
ncbi:unnamed protein product [Prorocentrum cordatum]|uniref:Uncharacterized protein n=1 Tax=Prorocentrum cordatum TaxID=2364126 RepID=A0ABN9RV77_9DINO|nr:unnamed protein product [Polarella glacialis]